MSQFWSQFWPNLAATVLGIVIGLPFALALNRHAAGLGAAQQRRADRDQASHALGALEIAIRDNLPRLQRFAQVLSQNQTLFDVGLDSSTWNAVQDGLNAELDAPVLRKRLAYHFQRLAVVTKMNDLHIELSTGVASALSGIGANQTALRNALTGAVDDLITETHQLLADVGAAKSQLG